MLQRNIIQDIVNRCRSEPRYKMATAICTVPQHWVKTSGSICTEFVS